MGLFDTMKNAIAGKFATITNAKFAEAVVGIAVAVAYADGEVESSEKQRLIKAFEIDQRLSNFDTQFISKTFNKFADFFDFDTDTGTANVKSVFNSLTHEEQESALRYAVVIAKADSEVDDKETAVLRKFGWRN